MCQLVVGSDYARLVGVNTGMAKQELRGAGWVVGAMLQPATGWLLLRRPITEVTDTFVDIAALPGLDGPRLAADVRAVMAGNPSSVQNHQLAIDAFENALSGFQRRMPVDDEGILLNRIVALVEQDADVVRVSQLCDRFGLSERSLQRLTARRLGLTPKWLIQRRRLREAADRLRRRAASVDLAMAATELGYADQAHFTRDFRTVTGITPGEFVAEPRPDPGTPIA